ncbi:MAG: hypothetical protein PHG16_07150 [Lachnospiraceae bacterium]|nr:hypothetical protein [Lachnospiraceae bacterium]
MFYKQFLEIIDILNPEFVENFDYWLATLPTNNQKNITASVVSARLEVSYSQAEIILKYAEKQKILEKYYQVKCPDCDYNLESLSKNEIAEVLINSVYCDYCEEDKHISMDDIYIAYKVIQKPDVSEEKIAEAIEKRLNRGGGTESNFSKADSLSNKKEFLYESFYNPDESAYENFGNLRSKLDLDYGENRTAKGTVLEQLILKIFNQIKYVSGTNDVKTKTNQFDCTLLCRITTSYPSVFNYLEPYFIVECKNEPKKKPNNTYTNKLESILDTNDAKLGIVFGRKDATKTCFSISHDHYLLNKRSEKQQIIITCCDKDLDYLIDKRVNLLCYLEYKIFQITANASSVTYEMFMKS